MKVFVAIAVLTLTASTIPQEKRTFHVTKVSAPDWTRHTTEKGNTTQERTFLVEGYDSTTYYQADCKEFVAKSSDGQTILYLHCVQLEAGHDYEATFYPNSSQFEVKCDTCVNRDTDKYQAYEIRQEQERK